MSFFIYDIIFLIVFGIFLSIFLYIRRKKLKREGWMLLYRTRLGIKFIDYLGKKYSGILNVLKYFVIFLGYLSMIAMFYLLIKSVQIFFQFPEFVRAVKIPPLAPLIPYLPEIFKVDFLPPFYFTYWIITIGIVAVVHEFSHGIFARLSNVKIKSTGFYFLGPFFGAFVEPDEKKMKKIKKKDQIAVLSAGSFSNWVMVVLFLLILWIFFAATFSQSGVIFNIYMYDVINKSSITSVGENLFINFDGGLNLTEVKAGNKTYFVYSSNLENLSSSERIVAFNDLPAIRAGLNGIIVGINGNKIKNDEDLKKEIFKYKPGDQIIVETLQIDQGSGLNQFKIQKNKQYKNYNIILAENPANMSLPYLGIATIRQSTTGLMSRIRISLTFFKDPNTYYYTKFNPELIIFIYNLIWWIILINFSVALVNMLPVGIFDGGRVFYLTMLAIFKREKVAKILFKISTYVILGIFALLMVLWAFAFF